MSKEQWGHGYRKGYDDALKGINISEWSDKESFEMTIEGICRGIWIDRHYAESDKSLFPVKDIYYCWGFGEKQFRAIYEYFQIFQPRGFYISGPRGDMSIEEDFIVVPPYSAEAVIEIAEKIHIYKETLKAKQKEEFFRKWGINQ